MSERIAIIGSGIAGMACAHFLHKHHDITLFERNTYAGGHTHTVEASEGHLRVPIDTGFMVFNRVNYPNLIKLFDQLQVPVMETDMSFSVQHLPSRLEYSGSGLNGLFAQRHNFLSIRHIDMLRQIDRFNRQSVIDMDNDEFKYMTVAEYVKARAYGEDMLYKYLLPMSGALWSTPTDVTMQFPAVALIRFFRNHGFLGLNTQHRWYTIKGGSREYRNRLVEPFKDRILLNDAVTSVRQSSDSVLVSTVSGSVAEFDRVILATHADEALALLDQPTSEQQGMLAPFKYQANIATLHTDESVMPKTERAWSSWNYRIEQIDGSLRPSCIYYMNKLQRVSQHQHYFVSINEPGNVDPARVIQRITYHHPVFTLDAMKMQPGLMRLNQDKSINFCGSYFRYGFHEDAFTSAIALCKTILGDTHPMVAEYTAPLYDDNVYVSW